MADWQDMLAAGITMRQAYYWTNAGHLHADNPACGSGRTMTWPASEVRVARLIRRLLNAGFTLPMAVKVARGEREPAPGVRVVIDEET